MTFEEMELRPELLRAIREAGYDRPTPIQERAIPKALAGRDLMCCAQTGTGKTAAFALPILQRLSEEEKAPLRALILVPTRELAIQVANNVMAYAEHLDLVTATAFGGVPIGPQEMMLRHGVDVFVATPGRLLDHMWRGNIDFRHTRYVVLDEADRMLDMGFIKDVSEIVHATPPERQTMLFSATLDNEIRRFARDILREPERIEVAPPARTLDTVDQFVIRTTRSGKRSLLERLIRKHRMKRTIVFARTKSGASALARELSRRGFRAAAFHSDRDQGERIRTLEAFREGRTDLLVATDIAARGIDIDDISHVVNYDIPYSSESYVHRIGRTARAGRRGVAISLVAPEEMRGLKGIERLIDMQIPWLDPDHLRIAVPDAKPANGSGPSRTRAPESSSHAAERGGSGPRPRRRSGRRRGRRRDGRSGGERVPVGAEPEREARAPSRAGGSTPRDRAAKPRAAETPPERRQGGGGLRSLVERLRARISGDR